MGGVAAVAKMVPCLLPAALAACVQTTSGQYVDAYGNPIQIQGYPGMDSGYGQCANGQCTAPVQSICVDEQGMQIPCPPDLDSLPLARAPYCIDPATGQEMPCPEGFGVGDGEPSFKQ